MVFLPDPTLLSLVDDISSHLTMIKITHPPIKISVVLGTRPEAIKTRSRDPENEKSH